MATEIKLPNLGDGVDSGEVLELFVGVGDVVEKDQSLLEIETDKATANVPSDEAGKIVEVLVAEGDTITVGQALFRIEAVGADSKGGGDTKESPAAEPPAAKAESASRDDQADADVEADEADEAEGADQADEADQAEEKQAAATQKSAPPARTEKSAKPEQNKAQEQGAARSKTDAPPQSRLAASRSAPAATETSNATNRLAPTPSAVDGANLPASPAIRRFAREIGVNLAQVSGSGPSGRILREDILEVVKNGTRSTAAPGGGAVAAQASSGDSESDGFGPITIEKMSRIRKTIAKKMHESWVTAPRVTNFDDADVTDLEDFRRSSKDDYAAQGIKLTSMPFVIKAVAMALRHNPAVNASVDMEQGVIIYKNYINIGIAVDTERGLVVPCLRNADQLSIPDIARQLQIIATNARENKFAVEDLRGGTFSISNLGAIGGTYSTPIINVPESAILLLGRTRKLPVVVGDEIKPRLMMPLSLSYDHRLVDGAMAARFLNDIIGYLKAPSRLLLAL